MGTSLAGATLASHHRRSRISPAVQEQILATQRPFSVDAFNSKSRAPAWKTIPSWYLVTTQDKAIPPATQLFMAKRADACITEVSSSHAVLYPHPDRVVDIILDAAKSVG
jgi:pimeloyl-ACP methyl ester carboxylesterase